MKKLDFGREMAVASSQRNEDSKVLHITLLLRRQARLSGHACSAASVTGLRRDSAWSFANIRRKAAMTVVVFAVSGVVAGGASAAVLMNW